MIKKLLVGTLLTGTTYVFYLGGAQLGYWSGPSLAFAGSAAEQQEWKVEYIDSSKQTWFRFKKTNSKPGSVGTKYTGTQYCPPKFRSSG